MATSIFWDRVDKAGDCWTWNGYHDPNGYGRYQRPGTQLVHRIIYEELVGEVPEGLVLDHLCRNPGCCNPKHLEPVTNRENILRGKRNQYKGITHCLRGHEFTKENTYMMKSGSRQCRKCDNIRAWEYHHSTRCKCAGEHVRRPS
jgi:hypothetical protein